ncbi:hypothetical protein Gotri_018038, partial [Gossypium trilobum]|nr:hypothetical protein [Gossypium trilobum]
MEPKKQAGRGHSVPCIVMGQRGHLIALSCHVMWGVGSNREEMGGPKGTLFALFPRWWSLRLTRRSDPAWWWSLS